MYSIRFQTTSDIALPAPDLPVGQSWEQLVDMLTRDVGPDAGRLLAEPIVDAGRRETHWHVECAQDPVPLARLSDDDKAALLDKLAAVRATIQVRISALQNTSSEAAQRMAVVLAQIIEVPNDGCIWSVDGSPVLTCWGRLERQSGQPDRTIRGAAQIVDPKPAHEPAFSGTPVAAAVAAEAVAAPQPRPHWLWALLPWLAFLVLLAIIYIKLLAACGLLLPGVLGGRTDCPAFNEAALRPAQVLNDELRRSIANQQARLASLQPCADQGIATAIVPYDRRSEVLPDTGEVKKRLGEQKVVQGHLDISLAWNGHSDLDLHVMCASAEVAYNSRLACGGNLDRDANNGNFSTVDRPVEHATWGAPPPAGHYRVQVKLYDYRSAPVAAVPFTVVVRDGVTEKSYPGVVTRKGERVLVFEFDK